MKKIKRIGVSLLAMLMLFSGLFVPNSLGVEAAVGRCHTTGGAVMPITYRINQATGWRVAQGAGLSAIMGTLGIGAQVTRPVGAAEHRTHGGHQYRRVRRNNQNIWVRSAHLTRIIIPEC